jgi:hypothetical protein
MEETIEYKLGKSTDFSKFEIATFQKIVIDAGEVSELAFDGLISKVPILLFIPNTINIEAIGALKIPNDEYKEKVFTKSQNNENSNNYKFELGWIVSLKPGNGKKLVEILSTFSPNVYATVRQENSKMKHILEKIGFIKSGIGYKSDRNNYDIELYIKRVKNTQ